VQVNDADEAAIVNDLLAAIRALRGRGINPKMVWYRHRIPARHGSKSMFVELEGDALDTFSTNRN
jgi:hypothetical protein